jgi:type I restriction enzyme, S subunit
MKTKFKETEIGMMIPDDWDIVKLDDVCDKITDGSHTSPPTTKEGKLIATVKNMTAYGFDYETCRTISENSYNELVKNNCQPLTNDVLIAKDGSVLKHVFVSQKNEEIVILSSIAILRPNTKIIDPYFLKYTFFENNTKERVLGSYVTGAVIQRIILKDFKKIPLVIPPLHEQQLISKIFSNLDSKIEFNQNMNKILKKISDAIFKHWFVDFEFPNEQGNPYKISDGNMVYNEELEKEIPKKWTVGKYSELVEIITGKGLRREEYVENGEFPILGANGELGRTNNFLFNENLILTGRVGTLGSIHIVRGKVWISDNVLISKAKLKENFHYAYYVISGFDFESLNRGSTQPLVTQTDLKNEIILIPDHEVLVQFEKLASSLFDKIFSNNLQNKNLTKIRDMLLPKLMSGKIRIPVEVK